MSVLVGDEDVPLPVDDPIFNASDHAIISIDDLLQLKSIPSAGRNVAPCILQLKQEFSEKGWCIVQMPLEERPNRGYHKIPRTTATIASSLLSFFDKPIEEKRAFSSEKFSIGYSKVDHKESLHYHTGMLLLSTAIKYPSVVGDFTRDLDNLTVDLLAAISEPVFECTVATLAHRADLPAGFGWGQIGMLDVDYYINSKEIDGASAPVGSPPSEVRHIPHFKHDLLSLNFLSTFDGLQLYDPMTKTWFAAPVNSRHGEENLGVLLLGDAGVRASKGRYVRAVHRVVYAPNSVHKGEESTPKIVAFYGSTTVEQINQDREPREVEGGENKAVVSVNVHKIERYYGLPSTKALGDVDKFSVFYSDDREKNTPDDIYYERMQNLRPKIDKKENSSTGCSKCIIL